MDSGPKDWNLQLMIIGANIFKMPIFHFKSLWDCSQLNKSKSFIQVPCVGIAFNHRIKL